MKVAPQNRDIRVALRIGVSRLHNKEGVAGSHPGTNAVRSHPMCVTSRSKPARKETGSNSETSQSAFLGIKSVINEWATVCADSDNNEGNLRPRAAPPVPRSAMAPSGPPSRERIGDDSGGGGGGAWAAARRRVHTGRLPSPLQGQWARSDASTRSLGSAGRETSWIQMDVQNCKTSMAVGCEVENWAED